MRQAVRTEKEKRSTEEGKVVYMAADHVVK
jgi:hypothetical protein